MMIAGSGAIGSYHLLDISGTQARLVDSYTLSTRGGNFALTDAAIVDLGGQIRLYGASRTGQQLDVQRIGEGGGLTAMGPLKTVSGERMEVSVLEPLQLGGVTYMATAAHDRNTVDLIRLPASGAPELVVRTADTPKSTLDGVSDLASLTIDGEVYLIAASSRKDGLSSFHLGAGGTIELSDTLTPRDGLWVDGLDALAVTELGGISYIIAGSAAAGSLSVIRINALGVMFITDQMLDTRDTRFDYVSRIETVTYNGRSLIVAGGGDGGISLLELMPDGTLFHHKSLEARTEWSGFSGGVTGLSAHVDGTRLEIFIGGAGGVSQFELSLADMGGILRGTTANERLTGGAGDDLIYGAGGNDTLVGGAGDDLIFAGAGRNTLTGGAGDDIFHIGPSDQYSQITDFEQGHDRIDLGDWGRIYDMSALTISERSYGAEISFGSITLRVSVTGGGPIPIAEWTQDDFLF